MAGGFVLRRLRYPKLFLPLDRPSNARVWLRASLLLVVLLVVALVYFSSWGQVCAHERCYLLRFPGMNFVTASRYLRAHKYGETDSKRNVLPFRATRQNSFSIDLRLFSAAEVAARAEAEATTISSAQETAHRERAAAAISARNQEENVKELAAENQNSEAAGIASPSAEGQGRSETDLGDQPAPASSELSVKLPNETYSAICLIAKDENLDIREWMVYHQRLGVGRVYVWDNNSSVPLINEIRDFVDSGFAVYQNIVHECDKKSGCVQKLVYQKCLDLYTTDHVWMGFIDTDEFVVIPSGEKLDKVLQRYESYGGLVLHWRWFASSGHITRPEGGVLPNYHTCCPDGNPHVKSFVFMDRAAAPDGNPHNFIYKDDYFAVNNEFQRVDGPLHSPPVLGVIYLNHYNIKSLEDYLKKMRRGRADAGRDIARSIDFFHSLDDTCKGECPLLTIL